MSPQADRNLLFGVLALQMNFVDREALIAAMRDWVEDKAQPLGSIFVARGDLAEEERVVVEMAVQRHLQRHAGDASRSLAAMSVDSGLRQSIAAMAERADITAAPSDTPAPQATLAQILGTLPPDKRTVDATPADEPPPARFRIVRPHAKGGLGAVFVAVDEELHREVALKEIQPRYARDHDARQRFVLEAQVTGGLEHPGIVPVYGFGAYGDGRPYYAMRFIRGESLQKQIEAFHAADRAGGREPGERQLALRKLLRSFVDVCNAVQYAHSRGVLHRDLKPDNVMLGAYGETLVVDWGLAKLVTRTEEQRQQSTEASLLPASGSGSQTQVGRAVGTPVYMSPEQALGWHDTLTPAADIYSLGATLYMLLAGTPPVSGSSVDEVLLKVQTGAIQPPRAVNANVPAALDAIVQKAMARQPSERYATPRQLADDVEAWLADEPVAAYLEPWTTTAQRWVTRNLALVSSVGATLLVGVVSLTIGVVLLSAANQRETDARRNAEDNFKLARSVVNEYLVKVSDDPRLKSKGLEQLRHSLLETARKFFDRFREQESDHPEVKFEQADALIRLASSTNDLGTKRHAVRDYETALAMIDELVALQGWKPEYAEAAVRARVQMADVQGMLGETAQAMQNLESALALDRQLGVERPTTIEYRRQLAQGRELLGREYYSQARPKEAQANYERAIQLKQQLAEESPARGELWMALANTHGLLGLLLEDLGETIAAEQRHRKKIELTEKADALGYDSPEVPCSLVESYLNLSNMVRDRARYDLAEEYIARCLQLAEELCRDHPGVLYYDYVLIHALQRRADTHLIFGKAELARPVQQRAEQVLKKLLRDNADVHALTSLMITCHDRMASVEFRAGNWEESQRQIELALALAAEDAARLKEFPGRKKELAYIIVEKAIFAAETAGDEEDFKAAEKLFAEALAILDQLAKAYPHWPAFAQYRVNVHQVLGTNYVEMELFDQGRRQFELALTQLDELDARFPQQLLLRRQRAEAYRRLGELELHLNDGAAAWKHFEAAVATLQPLVEQHPEMPVLRHELATIYQFQANVALNFLRDFGRAKQAVERAEPLAAELCRDQPNIPGFDNLLGRVRYFEARIASVQLRYDDVLRLTQDSLERFRPLWDMGNEDALLYVPLCHSLRAAVYYEQGDYERELAERDALVRTTPPFNQGAVQLDRALCLVRLKRFDDAIEQLDRVQLDQSEDSDASLYYFRGCYYAIAAAAQLNDAGRPEPERRDRFTKWSAKTLPDLKKAQELGYFSTPNGLSMLRADAKQAPEAVRPIFERLLDEVETDP